MKRYTQNVWPFVAALAILINFVALASKSLRNESIRFDNPGRFEFQIVESVDAHYLGDTPAHKGRHGLNGRVPNVSLGDPVYRAEEMIGHVTSLVWDRSKDSMDIEFDPEPKVRISIGDTVWVSIAGKPPK